MIARALAIAAWLAVAPAVTAATAPAAPAPHTPSVASPRAAAPDTAAADTSLDHYFEQLSDSTSEWFGTSAEPTDTAGLDTVLSDSGSPRPVTFSVLPAFAFNRVDGPTMGATVQVATPSRGRRTGLGRVGGKLAWAAGPNTWLGGGEYQNLLHVGPHAFGLRLFAGRSTSRMNRDHFGRFLDTWRAFLWGGDGAHYLREDGVEAALDHDAGPWSVEMKFRDMLERPLPVTATWNLTHHALAVDTNLAAARGRAHELALAADWRWWSLPIRSEVQGWLGGHGLGGDFDYQRVRVASGAEIAVRRTVAIVPQVMVGRLTGDPLPQEAFYLGSGPTLRSVDRDALGGTRIGLARVDALLVPDILSVLHVRHPATLPFQVAAFGATGAVWGQDPYGGPGSAEDAWPARQAWRSEVGASLLYATSMLGETSSLRGSVAWPVGPHHGGPTFTFGLSRALDLLRPPSE